jgi:predicted Zn-dependent protease
MLKQASDKNALAPDDHLQVIRLRAIASKLIPFSYEWNPRAKDWNWQVNLIGSDQVNAFCMPGGKIAFFHGILKKLDLTDDEVAMVMGHEIAHALREHARERMGKSMATNTLSKIGGALASVYLGVDPRVTDAVAMQGANLINLKFSREDESEADLVGMELAARAGYDPHAGVTLWQKMGAANKARHRSGSAPIPLGSTRIKDIEANLPKVEPLYERAKKP